MWHRYRIRPKYTTRKASYKTNTNYRNKGSISDKTKVRSRQNRIKMYNKNPVPTLINKPIVKLMGKPIKQPMVILKVPIPEISRINDKTVPIPDYTILQMRSGDDSSSRMVKRKIIQYISREIPIYPDPAYRPPPKPVLYPKFLEAYQILTQKFIGTSKKFHHFKMV